MEEKELKTTKDIYEKDNEGEKTVKEENTEKTNKESEEKTVKKSEDKSEENKTEDKKEEKMENKTEDKKSSEDKKDSDLKVEKKEEPEEVNVKKLVNAANNRNFKKLALIIAGSVAAVCVVIFGILTYYVNSQKIYFDKKTFINGIDVSGLTVDEAVAKFNEIENNYNLVLSFADEKNEVIKGKDIDFKVLSKEATKECLEEQNDGGMIFKLFSRGKKKFDDSFSYDKEKLSDKIDSFEELDTLLMEEPQDACLEVEDGIFVIKKEVMGNTLDVAKVALLVSDAIGQSKSELELEDFYEKPEVYSDDEKLNKDMETLNDLIGVQVTYEMPSGKEKVLNGKTMIKWLKVDDEGNYYKSKSRWNKKIKKYVEKLAQKVDTTDEEHKFITNDNKEIMLKNEGYYGYKLDVEAEIKELTSNLNGTVNVIREPVYSKKEAAPYTDNYGFGGSYVEISIKKQHLWVYIDGEVTIETDVVTGKKDGEHETSVGAFAAYDKQTNKKLTGEIQSNGKPEYVVKVKNWIRVTNYGIGIHETSYRSRFGGDIYLTDGSHGCINVPKEIMPEIYKTVYSGMPIAIY